MCVHVCVHVCVHRKKSAHCLVHLHTHIYIAPAKQALTILEVVWLCILLLFTSTSLSTFHHQATDGYCMLVWFILLRPQFVHTRAHKHKTQSKTLGHMHAHAQVFSPSRGANPYLTFVHTHTHAHTHTQNRKTNSQIPMAHARYSHLVRGANPYPTFVHTHTHAYTQTHTHKKNKSTNSHGTCTRIPTFRGLEPVSHFCPHRLTSSHGTCTCAGITSSGGSNLYLTFVHTHTRTHT